MRKSYVTSKNIIGTDLVPEFINEIQLLERNNIMVEVTNRGSTDIHISAVYQGCDIDWNHNELQYPILTKHPRTKPVTLPEDLFTI